MLIQTTDIDDLPQCDSTRVKNRWGTITRAVRTDGPMVVTNRKHVDVVVIAAVQYRALIERLREVESHQQSVLDQLAARFDQRLSGLQDPGAIDKVDALFSAKGQATTRPIAGRTF